MKPKNNFKTFDGWTGSLDKYLEIGDLVDDRIVKHFYEVMPPAWHTETVIQLGEPYSIVGYEATFSTIKRTPEGWMYVGHCFRGKTEPVGDPERAENRRMKITLGCGHDAEVEDDHSEDEIHLLEHMSMCVECWTKLKERELQSS